MKGVVFQISAPIIAQIARSGRARKISGRSITPSRISRSLATP